MVSEPAQADAAVRQMRSRAQAISGGVREDSVAAVVERVFAVQAQDAVAASLGMRVRGRGLQAEDVRAAYEDERSIVRGWFMRGTLHTIPSADARWVLRLLAPRFQAAAAGRYRQLGLDEGMRERADQLIRRALDTHGPLTRRELTEHLEAAPEGQAPFHLIRHAALNGILCHGPERDGEATYVLLDDWLPTGSGPEGDEAVAQLARRYLAEGSPDGFAACAAWSGLPVSWAGKAWKTLAGAGEITELGGLSVLTARPAPAPEEHDSPDVRLLPAYDGYLLGYRNRDLSVPIPYQRQVWPGGGLIRPVVLADGLAVGTWAGRKAIKVEPFEPLPPRIQALIDAVTS